MLLRDYNSHAYATFVSCEGGRSKVVFHVKEGEAPEPMPSVEFRTVLVPDESFEYEGLESDTLCRQCGAEFAGCFHDLCPCCLHDAGFIAVSSDHLPELSVAIVMAASICDFIGSVSRSCESVFNSVASIPEYDQLLAAVFSARSKAVPLPTKIGLYLALGNGIWRPVIVYKNDSARLVVFDAKNGVNESDLSVEVFAANHGISQFTEVPLRG